MSESVARTFETKEVPVMERWEWMTVFSRNDTGAAGLGARRNISEALPLDQAMPQTW